MEIMKVLGRMVCTQRVAGLGYMNLRILENNKGKKLVAVDPVGAREGNWVFTASGSAARFACPNPEVQTDLIDYFDKLAPMDNNLYVHTTEGKDDMPAHIKSALTNNQISLSIKAVSYTHLTLPTMRLV